MKTRLERIYEQIEINKKKIANGGHLKYLIRENEYLSKLIDKTENK